MIQKQNDQQTVLNQNPSNLQPIPLVIQQKSNQRIMFNKILLLLFLVVIGWGFIFLSVLVRNSIYLQQTKSDGIQQDVQKYEKILSEIEFEQLIENISRRPIERSQLKQKKLKATKQAYFAYELYKQPHNKQYMAAEKYYYNKKYQIQKYFKNQLPLCVVSSGRNIKYQNRYRRYIDSLGRQQYNNFKVVIVDDYSSDGSVQAIKKYLQTYYNQTLKLKIIILSNNNRQYALYSRDLAITNYCADDDIIVELDTDDQFIGRQVLSTINAIYNKNPQIWAMYSSYVYWSPKYGQPTEGISQKIPTKILQQGTYRLTTQWYTSATRTFLKRLYSKIDKNDFKNQKGMFYRWTSDLFVHYSLIQMAGLQHYKYIHEVFYYYYLDHNKYKGTEKAIDRLNALSIRRYKRIKNLSEIPQRIEQNENIQWLKQQKNKLMEKQKNQS